MEFLDIASIIGLVAGFAVMIFGIIIGEKGVPALMDFIDPPSLVITFGGTLTVMMTMSASIKEYFQNFSSIKLIFKTPKMNEQETIKNIIDLANVARKEGLLALEEAASGIDDEFLKKGILLAVDGTDQELVRSILETELVCIEERHKAKIGFWDNVGAMGPAWGMIGTLIGLVNMLQVMDDPSAIGPNMAVALITTFYGSVLANWICAPVSAKLKANSSLEIMMKEVTVEGILSIQAGENPRVIEEKLKSFLAPSARASFSESEGGEA